MSRSLAESNFETNSVRCKPGDKNLNNPTCYLYCDNKDFCNDQALINDAFTCSDKGPINNCDPTEIQGQNYGYDKESCHAVGCCWHEVNSMCYSKSLNLQAATTSAQKQNSSGFLNGDTGLMALFVIMILVAVVLAVVAFMYCCCKQYLCCGCNDPKGNDVPVIYADVGAHRNRNLPSSNDGYRSNTGYYEDGYNDQCSQVCDERSCS